MWCILSSTQIVSSSYQVPLCFYNVSDTTFIEAPESVRVTLEGKRSLLKYINQEKLALHIDAHDLHNGSQALEINNATLFLPDSIKLVHYQPLPLIIQYTATEIRES